MFLVLIEAYIEGPHFITVYEKISIPFLHPNTGIPQALLLLEKASILLAYRLQSLDNLHPLECGVTKTAHTVVIRKHTSLTVDSQGYE